MRPLQQRHDPCCCDPLPGSAPCGRQQYADQAATLITTWQTESGTLEQTDLLAWPQDDRPPGGERRRVIIRRRRCRATVQPDGTVCCALRIMPRDDLRDTALLRG